MGRLSRIHTPWASLVLVLSLFPGHALGQDVLNDNITYSPFNLEVKDYVTLPSSTRNIISMGLMPGDERLYVSTMEGTIYSVTNSGNGTGTPSVWFDLGSALNSQTGLSLNYQNFGHGGLRATAFHPGFADPLSEGYGRFYTSMMVDRPGDVSGFNYLGSSTAGGGVAADSVLAEWSYDFNTQQVAAGSYRELFRIGVPVFDHTIKQVAFNQYAAPGDPDYGLLYIAHGDASSQDASTGGGQNTDNALGKILRVNPLADGVSPYTTPGNPFVGDGDPGTLDEIYAYGFRNPDTFSFNRDVFGNVHLLDADIGRSNMEEINIIVAGGNYGWSEREGTFVHLPSGGYYNGIAPLPADEADFGYLYPAAQYDPSYVDNANPGDGWSGVATASGHVISNPWADPDLLGEYLFGDFAVRGTIFHANFQEMLETIRLLDPDDPTRDEPGELTQAIISKLRIAYDHDDDMSTALLIYDDFNSLINAHHGFHFRVDLRFGEGPDGAMFVSSKELGKIYLVTNTVPEPSSLALAAMLVGAGLLRRRRLTGRYPAIV